MSRVRAVVSGAALRGPEEARQVIDKHLHSDAGGRCLACGELEPCPDRNTGYRVLFAHNRQLPRRRPMALIGTRGDFSAGSATAFEAFGPKP